MNQPEPMPEGGDPTSARSNLVRPNLVWRFTRDLFYLPWAHKSILGLALVMCVYGWIHLGYRTATASSAGPTTMQSTDSVENPQGNSPGNSNVATIIAPFARRVGGSIMLGYVIGWAFRTFLKIMASVTALAIGLLALLSYFHVMNVDMTWAQKEYGSASAWITDQAGKVRDGAMAHVHSTGGGVLGAFLGLRKKTVL
jgi:uncharacterized membrane protein (Fun14 family)